MKSSFRLNWNHLLYVDEKIKTSSTITKENDTRNIFKKDFDTICFSSSFRRLQDKAQVFPLEDDDFVRTRLTHSIEVMSIAESLGEGASRLIEGKEKNINQDTIEKVKYIPLILRSAALIHDIGNPPFGHLSEGIMREWFSNNLEKIFYSEKTKTVFYDEAANQKHSDRLKTILGDKAADFINFDGNAEALRIIYRLQTTSSNNGSMKLSYPLLATIIKYPRNFNTKLKKQGFFYSERELYEEIQTKLELNHYRHPLVFLLEAADDIAYLTTDIEDAAKKGLLDIREFILKLNSFIEDKKGYTSQKNSSALRAIKKIEKEIIFILTGKKTATNKASIRGITTLLSDEKYKLPEDNLLAIHKVMMHIKGTLISQVKKVFANRYELIMKGKFESSLLSVGENKFIEEFLRDMLKQKVYYSCKIIHNKILAQKVINKLLDVLVPSALNAPEKEEDTSAYLCSRLISDNFYNVCANEIHLKNYRGKSGEPPKEKKPTEDTIYYKLLMVIDTISGMTDSYAERIYNLLC